MIRGINYILFSFIFTIVNCGHNPHDDLSLDSLVIGVTSKNQRQSAYALNGFQSEAVLHSERKIVREHKSNDWKYPSKVLDVNWDPNPSLGATDSHKDLVQPNELHLDGVPAFIQQPKPLYYTLKDHPANIECIAEPVSHAVMKCAEKIIPYKGPGEPGGRLSVVRLDSHNRPDPHGDRWRITYRVHTKEVEEWFDLYACHCEVWNKVIELQRPKKVFSNTAVVMEAYIGRKFEREPASIDLHIGQTLDLTCIPPKSKPIPEVYWLKDGKHVTSQHMDRQTNDKRSHYYVRNVTTKDSGNYTCVAELLGIEYRYSKAMVHVFDGKHAPEYLQPVKRSGKWNVGNHYRHNLAIYAGAFMSLVLIVFVILLVLVKRRHFNKYRTPWLFHPCCMNGDYALKDKGHLNRPNYIYKDVVSNDHCSAISNIQPGHMESSTSGRSFTWYETLKSDMVDTSGTMVYMNKITQPNNAFGISRSINAPFESIPLPPIPPGMFNKYAIGSQLESIEMTEQNGISWYNRALNIPVPVNGTVVTSSKNIISCSPVGTERTPPIIIDLTVNTPKQCSSNPHPITTAVLPVHQSHSPDGYSSNNSTTNTTSLGSSREEGGNLYNSFAMPHQTRFSNAENIDAIYSEPLNQPCTTPQLESVSKIHGRITAEGCTLSFRKSSISVVIPRDMDNSNTAQDIYLAVCHEDPVAPNLPDSQTQLSPVVELGPPNMHISRPLLLSLQHCADLIKSHWSLHLLRNDLPLKGAESNADEQSDIKAQTWKELLTIDSRIGVTHSSLYRLDTNNLQFMTNLPGNYCLVGETIRQPATVQQFILHNGIKLLSIIAFLVPTRSPSECSLRIYVLPSIGISLDYLRKSEKRRGAQQLDQIDRFPFEDNGIGLCFQLHRIQSGWRSKLQTEQQEIPFRHIWNGVQTSVLHCSFTFERVENFQSPLKCSISISQSLENKYPSHTLCICPGIKQVT